MRQLRAALDDMNYEIHRAEPRRTAFDDAARMLERAEADMRRAREAVADLAEDAS